MPTGATASPPIELRNLSAMNRIRDMFTTRQAYEPIENEDEQRDVDTEAAPNEGDRNRESPFSLVEYSIFVLEGIAMLWGWNMFFAAAPYFQTRFESNNWILVHFQSAEISMSSAVNVGVMLMLTKMQKNASYSQRVLIALVLYTIAFTLLALSTLTTTSAGAYFGFLLVMIALTAGSTGLVQNGLFAFVSGFARNEYIQGIMTGQGIAGVLPPLAQIITVLAVPAKKPGQDTDASSQSPKSAFIYFLTATGVSVMAFVAMVYLIRRQSTSKAAAILKSTSETTANGSSEGDVLTGDGQTTRVNNGSTAQGHPSIGLWTLLKKLPFFSAAVFICFAVTMVYPVFTAAITSVSSIDSAVFIPLGFLIWSIGDLLGRLFALSPQLSLMHYPFALFCLSMARLVFIPLYYLCNVGGRGAIVNSDTFYLFIVQGLFGLSNGYLGSQCMMGGPQWVAPEEREVAGGYMGLMLVAGLTVGSFLSFLLGSV